ncbi:MAG: hypothetical protein E7304_12885 [Butyrivibrio sp.]|jgi:integrase|nr:hypothetical protein [Butyrivibrio sp.]
MFIFRDKNSSRVTQLTGLFFMSKTELLTALRQIELVKHTITMDDKCDTIHYADTACMLMLNEKQLKLKRQLIAEVHSSNGTPRTIKYVESKQLWSTLLPGKKPITAKTEEALLDKLMEFYGVSISSKDYSVATIFEKALAHKDRTEAVNPETLYHLKASYNRFISDSMAHKDVRNITSDILSEYTLNMLREAQEVDDQGVTRKIKKKAFLDYKSVLNLIFTYALHNDIITVSPLSKMNNKAFIKECDCSKAVSEQKIFSEDELETIKTEVRSRMKQKKYNGYFINGYAILLSIETGMRAGELPALKWCDIHENYIHIHAQQLSNKRKGGKEYYYADWTKDEKGVSRGGRKFPLTNNIRNILDGLKSIQEGKGIHSEFVFCNTDGEWIKTDAYITCLRRLLTSLGFSITNNHAFRMSLNSIVLAGKLNLPVAKRAELLGHSVETNMMYYTYATKDDMDDLVDLFNDNGEVSPRSHLKIVNFEKEKSLETADFKAL